MNVRQELNALLQDESPEERTELERAWDLAEAARPAWDMEVARTDSLRDTLRKGRELAPRAMRAPRLRLAAAATIVALVGVVAVWGLMPTRYAGMDGTNQIATYQLPDGSSVVLSPGSSLTGPGRFSSERHYRLDGEGWFSVVFEGAEEFRVETRHARVVVLGTEFFVRGWAEGVRGETAVHLKEGRIRLESLRRESAAVIVEEGQAYTVGQSGIAEDEAYGEASASAWMTRDFLFRAERLGHVLRDIERRFDIELTWEATGDLERTVTGVFRQPDEAEDVIRDLATYLGVMYRETATGFKLIDRN